MRSTDEIAGVVAERRRVGALVAAGGGMMLHAGVIAATLVLGSRGSNEGVLLTFELALIALLHLIAFFFVGGRWRGTALAAEIIAVVVGLTLLLRGLTQTGAMHVVALTFLGLGGVAAAAIVTLAPRGNRRADDRRSHIDAARLCIGMLLIASIGSTALIALQ